MRGDWLPARVLFSLRENVVGSFFFSLLVGLDAPPPLFLRREEKLLLSAAPGPPRLSVGAAAVPELAVRSRPRPVGSRALHLMRSGCLFFSTLARRLRACPAPRTLPHALEMRTILPACGPTGMHGRAPRRPARLLPATLPACLTPGTPAAGAGGRGPCWPLPGGSRSWVGDGGLASHRSLPGFCASPSPPAAGAERPA